KSIIESFIRDDFRCWYNPFPLTAQNKLHILRDQHTVVVRALTQENAQVILKDNFSLSELYNDKKDFMILFTVCLNPDLFAQKRTELLEIGTFLLYRLFSRTEDSLRGAFAQCVEQIKSEPQKYHPSVMDLLIQFYFWKSPNCPDPKSQ